MSLKDIKTKEKYSDLSLATNLLFSIRYVTLLNTYNFAAFIVLSSQRVHMVYNMEENINITVNNRCLFAKAQTRPSLSLSLSFTVHVPTLNHLSTTPTTTFTTSLHPFNLFCFSSPKSRDEMNEKVSVCAYNYSIAWSVMCLL